MESLNMYLGVIVGWVWGLPLVILLTGTGILLTILLRGVQFRAFKHACQVVMGKYDSPDDPGDISHFKALTTAVSATVGLGNISGVAVALQLGGPGATFWMIFVGILGMAIKFSECSLAVMYRKVGENGVQGGPMWYIVRGLGEKFRPLAIFFAVCCVVSSMGSGNMFQSNQVAAALSTNFGVATWLTGGIMAIVAGLVIIGGIKRIASVTSFLVPFMGVAYVCGALVVILAHIQLLPSLFAQIFTDAFTGTAAVGGFAGAGVRTALVQGVRRACFSNEAGQGSAPIAHAAARTKEPVREGVVALLEPFIDTVVICTMTSLVILISGAWTQGGEGIGGVNITTMAFDSALPGFGQIFVPLAITLFGFSTIISWSYYGDRAVNFLTENPAATLFYKLLFCAAVFTGAIWDFSAVVNFSDIMLGLMVLPNLIAIWLLFPKLKVAVDDYFRRI